MAKLRWSKTTPEQRKAHAKKMNDKRWEGKTQEEKNAHMKMMLERKREKDLSTGTTLRK